MKKRFNFPPLPGENDGIRQHVLVLLLLVPEVPECLHTGWEFLRKTNG